MKFNAYLMLLMIFFTTLASANDYHPFAVTLGGGYLFFTKKRDLTNTVTPALMVGYNFDDRWTSMLGIDLINANSSDPSKHHVHGFLYLADELYHLAPFHSLE